MKYLKVFEAFRGASDTSETDRSVKDICLELEHDGFFVTYFDGTKLNPAMVFPQSHRNTNLIVIEKRINPFGNHPGEPILFNYNSVFEVVNRLREFLGNKYISTSVKNTIWINGNNHHKWTPIEPNLLFTDIEIKGVMIK